MESFATPYPVLFHDGEEEHDKGLIGVHSVLTFKRFQALLSQKTGVPTAQLSSVLVCRRSAKDTRKNQQQKLPINENTNFNIILNQHNPSKEKDCYFLVSVKRSKKERKGTSSRKRITDEEESLLFSRFEASSPSDERPSIDISSTEGSFSSEPTSPVSVLGPKLEPQSADRKPPIRAEKVILRREMPGVQISINSPPLKSSSMCQYCHTCKKQNISPPPFHLCIHDRIVVGGVRRGPSPAGVIGRPVIKRYETWA